MAQLTFYHLQKLVLVKIFNGNAHIQYSLDIWTLSRIFVKIFSNRFIRNLEAAIKDKEKYSSNLGIFK